MSADALQSALARSPYLSFLGVTGALNGDELTLRLPYREELLGNPLVPALHGGVIGALLEATAIAQLLVQLKLESYPKPVNVAMDYLRVGHPRDTFARAQVTRHGSRVAHVRAEAWQDVRAEPIALLHGHFLLSRPERD